VKSLNILNEVGMIAEKAVENWLNKHGYPNIRSHRVLLEDWRDLGFYSYLFESDMYSLAKRDLERTDKLLTKQEKVRIDRFIREVLQVVADDSDRRHHSGFFPDLIAKMPNLTFIEVKSNNAKLEPRQRIFFDLARKHGFGTKVVRVLVKVESTLEWNDY
jgi:hypothetical protein